MLIRFKDIEYTFPSSLADIKLSQRIEFYALHGKFLDEEASRINAIEDLFDKEAEQTQWYLDLAARSLSFYTGIPYESIRSEISIIDLLEIYNTDISQLHQQESDIDLLPSYLWDGEEWFLAAPEVLPGGPFVFNEFLHSKEIVRQLNAVGKSKWDALPYLCAIYLRKKDEPFTEELVRDGSERLRLMQELPLSIAIAVGFFLSGTLNTYSTISLFSEKGSQKASTPPATSTNGDG